MQIAIKTVVSVLVILIATAVAKKVPAAAGLIGVMPLTGALILIWTYLENQGKPQVMQSLLKGALWGIVPSFLFLAVAFVGFGRNLSLPLVLACSFGVWLVGALVLLSVLR